MDSTKTPIYAVDRSDPNWDSSEVSQLTPI